MAIQFLVKQKVEDLLPETVFFSTNRVVVLSLLS